MKVLPIKGPDSYWAMHAYIKLLYGLKMLPMYMGDTLEEFFEKIEAMPIEDRRKVVRSAVFMVPLDKVTGELDAIMKFAADKNGVPFGRENMANLGPTEIMEAVNTVAQEFAAMKIDFLSPAEKKN